MPDVTVNGNGVAACCCASLLSQAGFKLFVDSVGRIGSPVLMLSEQTQKLIADVFGSQSLFQDAIRITKRVVKWGPQSETVILPHSGLVMAESALLARLWPLVNLETGFSPNPEQWTVISSKQKLPAVSQHEFGDRVAYTSSVELNEGASHNSCWVESTKNGWLFLLPSGGIQGSLISVGGDSELVLGESALIAKEIKGVGKQTGSFPAFPRIVKPLCGPRWIACGTAAVAFDPIAGEGAGNAVREGILAAAVIRAAVEDPKSENALLGHYSSRMLSGFLRHLEECGHFYRTAGPEVWWQKELEQLAAGLSWTKNQLSSNPASKFRLIGFELQGVAENSR